MNEATLPVGRPFNRKVFLTWSAILLPASFAVVPFAISLQREFPPPDLGSLTIESATLISSAANALLAIGLAALGLYLACRIGTGMPLVEEWAEGRSRGRKATRIASMGIMAGVVASLALILLDVFVFSQPLTGILHPPGVDLSGFRPPFWQGCLAAITAGVVEETLFRLFGLTFFAWLGSFLFKGMDGRPALTVLWIANVLAALAFGVSHLGNLAIFGLEPTPEVLVRMLTLNGVIGMIYGWLYWTYGLISAVIAHLITDVVIIAIGFLASGSGSEMGALKVFALGFVVISSLALLLWWAGARTEGR